jgi:hypothetical protein
MNGAAIAAVVSLAAWNLILWRRVHSRLAIAPSFATGLVSRSVPADD